MYSYEKTIIEIYSKLEKLGKLPKCKNDLKFEKRFKGDLKKLLKGRYISQDRFEELVEKCDEAMLGDEAKGFLTGIFFLWKMEKEMGDDFLEVIRRFGIVEG